MAAMKSLFKNRVAWAAIAMVVSFALLAAFVPTNSLIILLNGLLAGAMVALVASFYPLVRAAVTNEGPYSRGRQFGLGSFLASMAILVGLGVSIYVRADETHTPIYIATAFARWLAIWGAVLKITSPDFGAGLLYGRSRQLLWGSIVVGAVVAVIAIQVQGV